MEVPRGLGIQDIIGAITKVEVLSLRVEVYFKWEVHLKGTWTIQVWEMFPLEGEGIFSLTKLRRRLEKRDVLALVGWMANV